MAKLRRAPEARVGELELGVRRALVLSLVATIKTINEQIKQLERQITTAIREHPDGPIFLSLFKKPNSVITAAELLAEIGDCRGRYPTRDTLAADAGQAAVAVESGKRKAACFRWACNKRLRQAFVTLADTSRHHNPWAQDLYAAALARGHDHPRAMLFARALEDQGLLGPDGLALRDDDDDSPILVAWSDNGAEMTAIDTRQFMALMAITQHHGRPGTPTDQAHIESFFSHLKGDWPHLTGITDPAALDTELARIRTEYNTVRLHASIGYVTPDDEHHGRGPGIRRARAAGLRRA